MVGPNTITGEMITSRRGVEIGLGTTSREVAKDNQYFLNFIRMICGVDVCVHMAGYTYASFPHDVRKCVNHWRLHKGSNDDSSVYNTSQLGPDQYIVVSGALAFDEVYVPLPKPPQEEKKKPQQKKYILVAGPAQTAKRTECIQTLLKMHGGCEMGSNLDVELFNFLGAVCYVTKDAVIINDLRETKDMPVGLFARLYRLFVFNDENEVGTKTQAAESVLAVHVSNDGELPLVEDENAKLRKELAEALKVNEQLLHTMQSMQ